MDKQPFSFGLTQLIRLIIFSILFYSLINYFSNKTNKNIKIDQKQLENTTSKFIENIYNQIPDDTKQKISDIPNTPLVLGATQQLETLKTQVIKLPNQLINNLKKEILKKISQSILKETDE